MKLKLKKARILISSGGEEYVDDTDGSGHSSFARKLIDTLKENKSGQVLSSHNIFEPILKYVSINSDVGQTPEWKVIVDTGHDGGDFLFFAKLN